MSQRHRECGETGLGRAEQVAVGAQVLRDTLVFDQPFRLQLAQGAIDRRLIGRPEVADRLIEGALEVVSAERSYGEKSEDRETQ